MRKDPKLKWNSKDIARIIAPVKLTSMKRHVSGFHAGKFIEEPSKKGIDTHSAPRTPNNCIKSDINYLKFYMHQTNNRLLLQLQLVSIK